MKETVRDEDLKPGDVVFVLGKKRITRISPYRGPLKGCIGLADTDSGPGFSLWSSGTTERIKHADP
jgi:hypothetical protein